MSAFSFVATIDKLTHTPSGQEASMYGPIRDIFIHLLNYPSGGLDSDTRYSL